MQLKIKISCQIVTWYHIEEASQKKGKIGKIFQKGGGSEKEQKQAELGVPHSKSKLSGPNQMLG